MPAAVAPKFEADVRASQLIAGLIGAERSLVVMRAC